MSDEKKKRYDPRKGEGRLLSNMTGEPIKRNWVDDDVTEAHIEAAEQIIKLLKHYDTKKWQIPQIITEIEKNFKIVKYEEYDFKDSLWNKLSQKANDKLGQSIQGFRIENNKKIPHIGFSADLDYLDEFVLDIANIVKEELISAQMDVEKLKDNISKDKS
jgi:predicted house-cleaning noncanonical NTP pyrophosphatase (MazG superfamily)